MKNGRVNCFTGKQGLNNHGFFISLPDIIIWSNVQYVAGSGGHFYLELKSPIIAGRATNEDNDSCLQDMIGHHRVQLK